MLRDRRIDGILVGSLHFVTISPASPEAMINSFRVHVGLVISVSPDFFARRILQLLTQLYGPHVQVTLSLSLLAQPPASALSAFPTSVGLIVSGNSRMRRSRNSNRSLSPGRLRPY